MALQEQLDALRGTGPRAATFFTEVRAELLKVSWPTRRETYAATVVVIVVTAVLATFLGMVDLALSYVMQAILS